MTGRLPLVDLLKWVGAQFIVLHHLAFYGPMADHAAPLAPALFTWLDAHGRLAVQIFLVCGGFLAARAFAARPPRWGALPALARHRLLALVPPYAVAVLLALGATELARPAMDHPSLSATPSPLGLAANLLLLQSVLGIEALSAGQWYVAIDLQLYLLLAALLAAAHGAAGRWLVVAVGALSLLVVNRHAALDVWGVYFLGSYAMGAAAWWAVDARGGPRRTLPLAVLLCVALLALQIDFRIRIAVACITALGLLATSSVRLDSVLGAVPGLARGGELAYALFLVHFPVCLLVNAGFERLLPHAPAVQAAGVLLAWAASLGVAVLFHERVERPLRERLGRGARPSPVAA